MSQYDKKSYNYFYRLICYQNKNKKTTKINKNKNKN